jgi:hypothetical protein
VVLARARATKANDLEHLFSSKRSILGCAMVAQRAQRAPVSQPQLFRACLAAAKVQPTMS